MNQTEKWAKEIGQKIRRIRKAANMVQADIAKQLDLSIEGISSMERGDRLVGLEYLLRLPAILGCRITDLLPDSVVTDYDRARAADPRLQEIVDAWSKLSDAERNVILYSVRVLAAPKEKR